MFLSILLIISGLIASPVYAYPEYPAFEQTQFADSIGVFRWWESCWWRVVDPYVYLRCQPNGYILLVQPDGTVTAATASEIDRLFSALNGAVSFNAPGTSGSRLGVSRFFAGRTSAAPGDGIRLSNYYGETFMRNKNSGVSGYNSGATGVFRFNGTDITPVNFSLTGVFTGDSSTTNNNMFRFTDDNNSSQNIFGEEVPTPQDGTDTGVFSGGDGFFSENNLRSRMDNFFYQPLGLVGCNSIHDSKDGGIFGPIPCTSYPGVLGPVPRY